MVCCTEGKLASCASTQTTLLIIAMWLQFTKTNLRLQEQGIKDITAAHAQQLL